MKRLAVGLIVVFLVAMAAGAAVFIKQDQHDLSKFLSFSDFSNETSSEKTREPASDHPSPAAVHSEREPGSQVAAIPPPSDPQSEADALPRSEQSSGKPEDRLAFDIVRIQREGTSVFAGQGVPGQYVNILADGVVIGTAKVDENGEWVLVIEHNFANDDPKLDLQIAAGPPEQKVAAKADPEIVADVRAEAASVRKAASDDVPSPKVRDLNDRMMGDLQELVDEARREETGNGAGTRPGSNSEAAEEAPEKTGATGIETARVTDPVASPEPTARKTIPIPIQFVYREATFTPDGEKAVNLLLQYLLAGKLTEVTLSGHADERGTEALNMELSRQRLKTVENYLRSGGYQGKLELVPKGKSEPFTSVDRASFSREELYQLDRRVELRLAR